MRLRLTPLLYAACLASGLSASAQEFETPQLLSENREGNFGAFLLYPRIALAAIPATKNGLAVWTEKRFGSNPFTIDLIARQLISPATDPPERGDQLVGLIEDQLLQDGVSLAVENGARVHLVYRTQAGDESLLVHRVEDLSFLGGKSEILDRSLDYIGQASMGLLDGGRIAVAYRRGTDLLYWESGLAGPLVLAADRRPTSFKLATAGGRAFVAVASAEGVPLAKTMLGRLESFELERGKLLRRETLREAPGVVGGLDLAAAPDGRLALCWVDERFSVPQLDNTELFLRLKSPGAPWDAERQMSYTLADSLWPVLVWDNGVLHLIWQEHGLGAPEIWHRLASDDANVQVVSANDGFPSVTPSAAILDGRLVIVWRDGQSQRADLYFTRQK